MPRFDKKTICSALLMMIFFVSEAFAAPPPSANTCGRRWVLTEITPLDFGAFSIESGSGVVMMDNAGARSTTGTISLSSSIPATTFNVNFNNTFDPSCATFGFTISWRRAPRPLTGPGANIPISNVLVSIPVYGLFDVALPQTIAPNPGNTFPFNVMVYGDITVTSPQTPGAYQSPNHRIQITQGTRNRRLASRSNATVLAPLSIAETAPMDFGTVAGGTVAGTVVLTPGSARSTTGDAQILAASPGLAASFQITGEPNQAYALTYTNGVLENAGGQQMAISNFTSNSIGTLPGAGTETFQVGATLNVGPSQAAGNYSTTTGGGSPYSIIINYN